MTWYTLNIGESGLNLNGPALSCMNGRLLATLSMKARQAGPFKIWIWCTPRMQGGRDVVESRMNLQIFSLSALRIAWYHICRQGSIPSRLP